MAADQTINQNSIPKISSVEIACFVASFLLEGLQRCSGILFSGTLELSDDESRQTAAVPFVVSRAIAYISCIITNGCHPTQERASSLLFGTFLCALGAFLSFISNDDIWLTCTWGVLFGTGIGVAFPESFRVSEKFRNQTIFLVLHSAAPSFSCMMMPYLVQYLIQCFGLSGCLLVLSGVVMNAIPLILVAVYKIHLPSWQPKRNDEYNMSNPNNMKIENKEITIGIDNAAFEMDQPQTSNSHRKTSKAPDVEQCRNGSIKVGIQEQNGKKFQSIASFEGLDEVIRKLGRDPETIVEMHTQTTNNNLFEKSFSDEDVLFEVVPEKPVNHRKTKVLRSGSNLSSCSKNKKGNSISQTKQRTLSVPPTSEKENKSEDVNNEPLFEEECACAKPVADVQNEDNCLIKEAVKVPPKPIYDPPVIRPPTLNLKLPKPSEELSMSFMPNASPLKIKVHVVECTFNADDLQDGVLLGKGLKNIRKNGYRRHSNSLITSNYENVDFASLSSKKKGKTTSSFSKNAANRNSRMHLISEDEELGEENRSSSRNGVMLNEISKPSQPKPKCSWLVKSVKRLSKPSCLVIIYCYVIYELTLITLLTIFDDLVTDAGVDGTQALGVLPAFGLGGIAGRFSLKYFGEKLLLEGSHAAAAILFILNGIVVAGILWSPNLYWIGGFYSILGFLEVGICTIIWNMVSDFIDEEVKSPLFSVCTLICGLCTFSVPSIIGLSRDDLGEYDGLLQVTSGLSVLCAVLCYILPRFVSNSRHARGS